MEVEGWNPVEDTEKKIEDEEIETAGQRIPLRILPVNRGRETGR